MGKSKAPRTSACSGTTVCIVFLSIAVAVLALERAFPNLSIDGVMKAVAEVQQYPTAAGGSEGAPEASVGLARGASAVGIATSPAAASSEPNLVNDLINKIKFERQGVEPPPDTQQQQMRADDLSSLGTSMSSGASWEPPPSQRNAPTPTILHKRPPVPDKPANFKRARPMWEKGTPLYTGPYPDEFKPWLTAEKRPLNVRRPFSLPKPLWDTPTHQPDNDAILALAVNYRIIDYVRFVGTLRRTGYSGDIVLAVSNRLDAKCRKFLQAMDVIAYPVQFNCSKGGGGIKSSNFCDWHEKQDLQIPIAIIRHELYLSWAWEYNQKARLLILDFRDTFFQRDPFESLTLGRSDKYFQQLLVLEHWPYKRMSNCPHNSGWVQRCWGAGKLKNHPILCSGSYFATRDGMIDMESELLNEVRKAKCHTRAVPSDQGYVNYLYWVGRLPFATHEIRGDGIVNTVGALMGKNHRGSIGPLTTHWRIISPEGYVMDNDNRTRSAVVHQWDRFYDELYWTVDDVLACDDCYTSKWGHPKYSCRCFKLGCECRFPPN